MRQAFWRCLSVAWLLIIPPLWWFYWPLGWDMRIIAVVFTGCCLVSAYAARWVGNEESP